MMSNREMRDRAHLGKEISRVPSDGAACLHQNMVIRFVWVRSCENSPALHSSSHIRPELATSPLSPETGSRVEVVNFSGF